MLQDSGEISSSGLTADVAIIGGGPAGLTVAAELAAVGADVLVLEAGGLPYDRLDRSNARRAISDHFSGAQSLTRGSISGEPYFPLRLSRARGLGGSTNALKGHGLRGRPMDPIDFGTRFGTQWPIRFEDLSPYLPAASEYAGMRRRGDDDVDWSPFVPELGDGPGHRLRAAPFRHGPRDEFARRAMAMSPREQPRLVTSAVVVDITTDGTSRVTGLVVATAARGSFRVSASTYVLAAGGIDNARLLLNSRPIMYLMGQAADNVGRYFMEHLHYVPAYLVPSSPEAAEQLQGLTGPADMPDNWITLDDETVAGEELLRVAYLPVPVLADSLQPAVPAAGELLRMVPFGPFGLRGRLRQAAVAVGGLPQVVRAMVARARRADSGAAFALSVMAEQPPDRSSRITLSGKSDRLGMPLPHLHWRVGARDFEDARRSTELLTAEMSRRGVGEVVSLWDRGATRPPVVTGGWHHMGTTRMSNSPGGGVADPDCRLHGVDNVYVAGSSTFVTSGYANPTLTILALAVRLGRHLGSGLTGRRQDRG